MEATGRLLHKRTLIRAPSRKKGRKWAERPNVHSDFRPASSCGIPTFMESEQVVVHAR